MKVKHVVYVRRKVGKIRIVNDKKYAGWETVHHALTFSAPMGATPEELSRIAQERCSKRWKAYSLVSIHSLGDVLPWRVQRAIDGYPLF